MQSKQIPQSNNTACFLPPKKKYQELLKVYSDNASKDLRPTTMSDEAELVKCECCGMSEECTRSYIDMITTFFCGKWVCGLCSEAVKEHMKHDEKITMEGALESHMALCKSFNKTTRVNPNLSLAGAMRDIARKSSQRRRSEDLCDCSVSKVVDRRSMSCGPRLDVKIRRSSIQ